MATESKPEDGAAIDALIGRIADQLEARTGRKIRLAPLGSEGWMPLPRAASAFQWYFRKERKSEPRVYAVCASHGAFLRWYAFRPGRPTLIDRSDPKSCVICEGGIFMREVENCTCVRAPARCPVAHHRWHH